MTQIKKFADSGNTAVFTTRFIINRESIITYITHDEEDGAWQFHGNDEYDNYEDVIMVVALANIIEIDHSVLEIADMPFGHYAYRESLEDEWKVYEKGVGPVYE